MVDIIIFVVANILISNFLEKHKFRVATVTHALMFIVLLSIKIVTSYADAIGSFVTQVAGTEDGFRIFVNILQNAGVLQTTSAIAIFTSLSKLFVAAVVVYNAFKLVIKFTIKLSTNHVSTDPSDLRNTNVTVEELLNGPKGHLVSMRC